MYPLCLLILPILCILFRGSFLVGGRPLTHQASLPPPQPAAYPPPGPLSQVNEINFENMSNDDAVRVLREIVHKPGYGGDGALQGEGAGISGCQARSLSGFHTSCPH